MLSRGIPFYSSKSFQTLLPRFEYSIQDCEKDRTCWSIPILALFLQTRIPLTLLFYKTAADTRQPNLICQT